MADFFGGKLQKKKEVKAVDPFFDQKRKRSVEFIPVPHDLKEKVGTGGLDQTVLERAQAIIDNNSFDFTPEAQRQLSAIREGIYMCQTQRNRFDTDSLIAIIAHPAMQLKANGATFGFPIVTKIADLLIRFIEVLDEIDEESIDVISGFSTALNAVIVGQIKGYGGKDGAGLYDALEQACQRYFDKKKNA
jgi:hypothetical protein